MRRLGIAVASGVLLLGATAQAQTIDATGTVASSITTSFGTTTFDGTGDITFGQPADLNRVGGSVEAVVDTSGPQISFESGTAVSGPGSGASAYSAVDVTLTNNGDGLLVVDSITSTIIPAGLGFYLQDRSGALDTGENLYQGYPQLLSGYGMEDLTATAEPFATADFNFVITDLGTESTLFTLSGSLQLMFDGSTVVALRDLDDASGFLNGFVETYNNPQALAYAWDATTFNIPLNFALESSTSRTLRYEATVTSFTGAGCITSTVCLVGYSGFGDPIGRGGADDSVSEFSAFASNPIQGIVFDPQFFDPIKFNIHNDSAIPEPATWLSMIMGFGLLGAALRRRRMLAPA